MATLHIYPSTSCHKKPHDNDLVHKSSLLVHKCLISPSFLPLRDEEASSICYTEPNNFENPSLGAVKLRVNSQVGAATRGTAIVDVGSLYAIPLWQPMYL